MRINNQDVTLIGKGQFSRAYKAIDSDQVYILTKTNDDSANDNTKEIYTHIESPHVPYMNTIDTEVYVPRIGYCNLYESRFYGKLTAANTAAWRDYQALRKAWNHTMKESYALLRTVDMWHAVCENFIRYLEEHAIVSDEIIRALDLIHTWSSAYGSSFLFEFSPRNLKVDSNGNLILLDIVFFKWK
jgi:hypothetical protein